MIKEKKLPLLSFWQINENNRGFTLIEALVSVLIFSVIFVAIVSVFISSIKVQRYTLAYQNLTDQSSYVMEYISRQLRMAKKTGVSPVCASGTNVILGTNYAAPGNTSIYFTKYDYSSGTLKCKGFLVESKVLKDYEEGRSSLKLPLTSSKIQIDSLNVSVIDVPGQQPKATIYLEMEETSVTPGPKIKIQTTVSQRDLNI
jgi:prepilin-type N-terminal cleavage/methylation domain-containing protein